MAASRSSLLSVEESELDVLEDELDDEWVESESSSSSECELYETGVICKCLCLL